jgi:hypothetical protein
VSWHPALLRKSPATALDGAVTIAGALFDVPPAPSRQSAVVPQPRKSTIAAPDGQDAVSSVLLLQSATLPPALVRIPPPTRGLNVTSGEKLVPVVPDAETLMR